MIEITLPEIVHQPLVVNYGYGTDSTALLVLMVKMFEAGYTNAKPDRIMFADVGSEKDNTYGYIPVMQAYLTAHGFPEAIIVSKGGRGTSVDPSLHASCDRLQMMPSLAYGGKSCSCKWKADEMDFSHARWKPALAAWAVGMTVLKLIGYDASPADMRRSSNPGDEKFSFAYPLRDAGLKRPELQAIIAAAGLPDPGKSACWMCPASKPHEVVHLARTNPAQCAAALRMEARSLLKSAKAGRKMTTVGLGRRWAWREKLAELDPIAFNEVAFHHETGSVEWDEYQLVMKQRAEAPPTDLPPVEVESCDDTV
jgi:hypothetical protein